MIGGIGTVGSNIFLPSINFDTSATSSLQSLVNTPSFTAQATINGGFTDEGLTFLTLLTLLDDDKKLSLAQRLLLLELLLYAKSDSPLDMQILESATSSTMTNAVLPVTGYDASGAATSGLSAAPLGAFFSAGV